MKKAFKKAISILLIAVMVFGAAPLAGFLGLDLPELNFFSTKAEASIFNGLIGANQWTVDTDTGHLDVSGWGGFSGEMPDYTNYSETPWYNYRSYIKFVRVSADSIGNYAFGNLDSLQIASMSNSVASIGDYAFYDCDKLEVVTFGNGVTSIGDCAFMSCNLLSKITIPESVTSVGKSAFESTALSEIIIPNGTSTIGYRAFYDCANLKNAEISDSVTLIGDNAFYDCVSLETVTIGNGVETIGYNAFFDCINITDVYFNGTKAEWDEIKIEEGNETILEAQIHFIPSVVTGACGENLTWSFDESTGELVISGTGDMTNWSSYLDVPWYSYISSIKSVTIENGVTSIGKGAFFKCESLESVTIPDGVITIGINAFYDCYKLTSVDIPDSVISIGEEAFFTCYSLTSVTIGSGLESIGDNVFSGCISIESITVDKNNKNYSNDEFGVLFNKDKTQLIQYPAGNTRKSYTIPDSVITTGKYAFRDSDSLTSIIIPDSVTSIGYGSFRRCFELEKITIPDSVTSIGSSAFSDCESLVSVTIPDGITSIDNRAFYNCKSIKDVYYSGTQEDWSEISIGTYNEYLLNANIHFNHIHAVSTVKESADPTCNENGYKTGECVCGYSFTEIVPALKHKDTLVKVDAKAPTCTEIGWDAYEYCTACTYTTYVEKAALKHDIVIDKAVEATCTETGLTEGQHCSRCDDMTIKQNVIPALKHKDTLVKVDAKAPTCTEIGWDAYEYCTACTYTTYVEKAALKHDIVIDKAVEATCTETGLTEGQHCSRCDDMTIKQNVIPALKHKDTLVKVDAKAPTCTEIGWDAYEYCTACTYTTYVEKAALKHDIVIDKAVDATCTETGLTEGQHCSRCDDVTIKQETVPALNHKDTLVKVDAKAPTCTEIGWDAYEYCTACTYTTYVEKAALKHDIVIDKAVEATCTATGLTEGQHCSRCDGATVEQEVIPAKPHNPIEKYDFSKHWNECDCGLKTDVENHSFIGGNICSCEYKRTTNATLSIKNNTGSKTINYGETLKLTAVVINKPANARIYWYVDGIKSGEGEVFNVSFENGAKIVNAKLVDANGVAYEDANGNEISDSETVTINGGFFQKLISFFKNLFGINRTIVQAFKLIY